MTTKNHTGFLGDDLFKPMQSEDSQKAQFKKSEVDDSEYYDNIEKGLSDTGTIKEAKAYVSKVVKADYIKKLKKEKLKDVIKTLPEKGVYFHIVSNGSFDYFDIITRILELEAGEFILYASTWTMNYKNTEKMLELFDIKRLNKITFICGEYLQGREPLVFDTLKTGILERGQRIKAFKNHSKIILLSNGVNYYVCEGSANFTANPRTEQNLLCNSEGLYNFHKNWIEELF